VSPPIPFLDLKTPHRALSEEILAAWKRLLEDAAFIGGAEVDGFEREFAAFTESSCCVGMSNGTDALRLAAIGLGVQPGDEVITAAHTFIATTEAISQAGGRPVLVDVDPVTATLDPKALEAAITPHTRLIVPVHLYGQPADMDPILEIARGRSIPVLEDAAQAHGARYKGRAAGSIGDAACFSFYPGKNLGACGEAGAVTTGDAELEGRMRMLRDHGQVQKYQHDLEGWNARLDALQAAALRIKLRHLLAWNEQRREAARWYGELLEGSALRLPREAPDRLHVYHLYVVRHPERDRIQKALADAEIACGLHYPVPLHLQKAYAGLGHSEGDFPHSERWAFHGLSLPMFPSITREQVERVAAVLRGIDLEPQGASE
jgi:dTDP-4-amino-4,6-dideoxygalactose transaminase